MGIRVVDICVCGLGVREVSKHCKRFSVLRIKMV